MSKSIETKESKLEHYATQELKEFYQYDCLANSGQDDLVTPDADGDALFVGNTQELMSGFPEVRVLIPVGTKMSDVTRGLHKIVAWIERDADDAWKTYMSKVCPSSDD